VQAIARDCLADSMLRVAQAGYDIKLHVHDEIVVKVKDEDAEHCLEEILCLMSCKIPWAKGLNLNADGYHTYYYKKD
jgi:DNA polymerase